MADFVILKTQKENPCLHLKGYRYHKKRTNQNGSTAWRCASYLTSNCKASVITEGEQVRRRLHEHNHPADSAAALKDEFRGVLKDKARQSPHVAAPELYNAELLRISQTADRDALGELPTFNSLKDTIYREKNKLQPPLPSSAADVDLPDHYRVTEDGQPFLVIDQSVDQRILGFASPTGLKLIAQAHEIFLDGTFFVVPRVFDQLLTVHLSVGGRFLPCAYILLPGRSTAIYSCALSLLKDACISAGYASPTPTLFFTDFEQGLIQALRTVFPSAVHRGCHFHFTQRVWAAVQRLSLQTTYHEVPAVKSLVRKMVSLAFLPPPMVPRAWAVLRQDGQEAGEPNVDRLIDYFESTWMEGNFEVHQWNHNGNRGPRTNNHLEAWHRKINARVNKAHPNIYSFVDLIKKDEALNSIHLLQLSHGGSLRARDRKWVHKDRKLEQLESDLNNERLTMLQFLNEAKQFCGL
ncbi:uncharacterized protein LOC135395168 [Ornithodoros turicata]|uniref:uncharacterized protein LOC135395168 n=1 Tax=Ornithodoros turicata TaxID=34597 RepID=UPI00313A0A3E